MLQIINRLPSVRMVALSGGSDSMAVLDFCKKHPTSAVFVDHGTETSRVAKEFLLDYTNEHNIQLDIHTIMESKPSGESWEEFWRNQRLNIFWSYNCPVITGHNLDDCVETWLWSSCHGNPKIIPYSNRNIIRPFMLNKKAELKNWCTRKETPWVEDQSNQDQSYTRNFIRHTMMENALRVNPGIYKVIARKIRNQAKEQE